MRRALAWSGLLGAWILLSGLCLTRFRDPFPALQVSLSGPLGTLRDFLGIAAGYRRLTADLAWIQTLEYYGTPEEGLSDFERDNGFGKYTDLYEYCSRVARIDPHFLYVYYYGGAVLAWNLNRLDEAESLLRLGIANNPHELRLASYLAALAYQRSHETDKLIGFLEGFVDAPDCPNILRSVLANLYKKRHDYRSALAVWILVHQTGDPAYIGRADNQIQELAPLARSQKAQKPLPVTEN